MAQALVVYLAVLSSRLRADLEIQYSLMAGRCHCRPVVGKSQIESRTQNLKSSDFKSQIWEGKSQISNLEDPNQIKSPDVKFQIFSKSPKTYLLLQKIRRITMQLMSKSYRIWCYLVFIWPSDNNTRKKSVTLSVCKVEYLYTQTLKRQFRTRVHCGAARTLQLLQLDCYVCPLWLL